jgi:Fe-S-cluster containining protein
MEYFPTRRLRLAEIKMRALIRSALEALPASVTPANLPEALPVVFAFTQAWHRLFDEYLAACLAQHKKQGETVQCRAGCSNCCHHYPMSIEPFELISFYARLRQAPQDLCLQMERMVRRTQAFQALLRGDSDQAIDDALALYFQRGIPCVFLRGAGLCAVHAIRPMTCRMYFSVSRPELCRAEKINDPQNKSFIVYLPDSVEEDLAGLSARFEPLDLPESLFGGLERMNRFEPYFLNSIA